MNFGSTLQTEGWNAQATVAADTFKELIKGLQFTGIVDPQPDIDPRLDLGSDTRELCLLHVKRAGNELALAALVQEQQIAQLGVATPNPVWRIVKRTDNPADIVVRFWIVKVTPQDQ